MEYKLRPANSGDLSAIRVLIHRVRINPFGLHRENFLVAVNPQGRLLGCGQVKTHWDGSRELASIAVISEARLRGIASAIIRALLCRHEMPVYLICRRKLGGFYKRFGFETVEASEQLTAYFWLIHQLFKIFAVFGRGILIMKRNSEDGQISQARPT